MFTDHSEKETTQTFFSHGKILLSSEYLVLEGAKALALPLKAIQSMHVQKQAQTKSKASKMSWKSFQNRALWFELECLLPDFKVIQATDLSVAKRLIEIFKALKQINPAFITELSKDSWRIQTDLDFDRYWGWGTSSTLIANLAKWAETNPYVLLEKTFQGSGYDIACSNAKGPIFFRRNSDSSVEVTPAAFKPPFLSQLFLVYLEKKQNSYEAIYQFNQSSSSNGRDVTFFSKLTDDLSQEKNLENFSNLIVEHEKRMSKILKKPRIQESLFFDFFGQTKSLGAWGGDFALAICPESHTEEELKNYFSKKGFNTVFPLEVFALMG
ncbi:MAG: GHMP kinase [Deltaproteobacteria bacterium]|nr:GHMP kinase [Deltaproteobacteria bacterium]